MGAHPKRGRPRPLASAARDDPAAERLRRRRRRRTLRLLGVAGLHVFVLSAFALAQPLFDLLSRNAEFFAVRDSTSADIVRFALGVLLLPPAVILLVEAVAYLLGVLVWRAVHLVFVALLAALVVLQVAERVSPGAGATLPLLALLTGAIVAAAYLHVPAVRTFLTVLAPAPLVFAGLFLFNSPVTKLVFVEEPPAAAAAAVDDRTPVVVLLFDELSTASLMDGRGQIDRGRYPNFARLAQDATFYRDATTVHAWTEHAVPSILTGRLPKEGTLPVYADHRENLFTLLRSGYRLSVTEAITRLCPRGLCKREPTPEQEEAEELESFASDVAIVYLHVVLPPSLASRLPPIDRSWRDFRGAAVAAERQQPARERRCAPVCALVKSLDARRPGTLYYHHALVPHVPWRRLPSGKMYLGDTNDIPGLSNYVWQDDEALTRQAYARYLLQVGFADRALGLVLDRLREARVYDRTLLVVVADHGLGFEPGQPRRNATPESLHDIAFVPLLVKLPGQERGEVKPGLARTVDVLPTIADALQVEVPWVADGRSLLASGPPRDGTVGVMNDRGEVVSASLSTLLRQRAEDVRKQAETFGTGDWSAVFRAGPRGELVGRRLTELHVSRAEGLTVDLDDRALFDAVDPTAPLVPAFVTGRLSGVSAGTDVAIAVNGTVTATARTYESAGDVRFAVVVPEESFRRGANDLAILVAGGSGRALEVAEPVEPPLRLEGDVLRAADGTAVAVSPKAIRGAVSIRRGDARMELSGWAVDVERQASADAVAVFLDGRLLYTARGTGFRRQVPPRMDGIEGVGFGFALPASLVPPKSEERLRVFALSDERAGELVRVAG